jgi:hypothetical protein
MAHPQLVFIHVPKTGGVSLHNAIAGALPPGATLQVADAAAQADFLRMDRQSLSARRFISGHIELRQALTQAEPNARFITVLRDPVALILSAFNYMATWAEHPLHAEFRDRSFGDYVLGAGDYLQGLVCRQVTGLSTAAEAIPVLESCYALAVITGRIGEVPPILSHWLGVRVPQPGRENVTPGQGRITLDSRICARLLDVTREDRLLFEHLARRHGGLMLHPATR